MIRPQSLLRSTPHVAGPSRRFRSTVSDPPKQAGKTYNPTPPTRPTRRPRSAPSPSPASPAYPARPTSGLRPRTEARSPPGPESVETRTNSKSLLRSYIDMKPREKLALGGLLALFAGIAWLMDVLGPEEVEGTKEPVETVFDRRRNESRVPGAHPT